jgi:membrane protein involved in colicin uptake
LSQALASVSKKSTADNSSPDYKSLFLQAEERRKQEEERRKQAEVQQKQAEAQPHCFWSIDFLFEEE